MRSDQPGESQKREIAMKKLVVAAVFAAFSLSPASAKLMACTRGNLTTMLRMA
jgi:hypothetical protein